MRVRPIRTVTVTPAVPPALGALTRLAWNFYWTWNTDAAAIFAEVDRRVWESSNHNPLKVLQMCGTERLKELAHDEGFVARLGDVAARFDEYLQRPPQINVQDADEHSVIAYFSLEFAIAECLPNYSGGLGVLAGDHLKSASDLGLPLIGVGLLYREGYFVQELDPDGWQREEYHDIDLPSQPLERLHRPEGGELTVTVEIASREVHAAVWQIHIGKTPVILLDTDIDRNSDADREISARLYGGDSGRRLEQEILLGIGGIRALWALGMRPAVCHLNEGHSALLALERIRLIMGETGVNFAEARLPVTAATVFTTHTAVAAGIDLFTPELIENNLGDYYASMGLDSGAMIGLGRIDPNNHSEPFSMALLGLRLSAHRNGVSQIHGGVSRRLWGDAWPDLPQDEVPIGSITNGVHLPTWVSHEMGELYDRWLGHQWRAEPVRRETWEPLSQVPDDELWSAHERQRRGLIRRAREQHEASAARNGLATSELAGLRVLDPDILTIGFARRFAGYKRATLLFRDLERLTRIVNDAERPVQILFAGKAHPRDEGAKHLIREVQQMSRRPGLLGRVVLLDGYDVRLAREMVQGCDLWLNTPLRPLEASGTSGMKAAANGALNASVRDGWWAEAYRPEVGWAIGHDKLDESPEVQDLFDAASLYELLEEEIAPLFYDRGGDGIPHGWVAKMKASIASIAPQFNTSRMVTEYAERAYTPAAKAKRRLTTGALEPARELAAWLNRVRANWHGVRILDVHDDSEGEVLAGERVMVHVRVHPGELNPDDLAIEVVDGRVARGGTLNETQVTRLPFEQREEGRAACWSGTFAASQAGQLGYTVRVIACHPDLPDALSTGLILWA